MKASITGRGSPMTNASIDRPQTARQELGQVEQHGVDIIPVSARQSRLRDIFFVFVGSQMCFGIIVIGGLPIIFGLSFWDSVTSITIGLAIGAAFFGPVGILGARTGTSGPIASGAHFGVKGRLIATIITILIGLGFYALTVWTGGEALVAGGAMLFGWESTSNLLAVGAAIICVLTIVAAIIGHRLIVATETMVSYVIAAALLVTAIVLAPNFNSSHAGGELALGSFWPTWLLSATICAALPISYSTFVNDYTRYLPDGTSSASIFWAAASGMFIGCWLALVFAAYVTSIFVDPATPFVSGLIALSPAWLVVVLMLVGIIGSQPQGSLCIYNGGLALQTINPNIGRVVATVALSLVGLAIVFAGIYLMNMVDLIIAFLTLIEVAVVPWVVVNLIGNSRIGGRYHPEDLFAFQGGTHGRYWFSNGWNSKAVLAWALGSVTGLLFTESSIFTGPFAGMFGGVSLQLLIAAAVSALIYAAFERRA